MLKNGFLSSLLWKNTSKVLSCIQQEFTEHARRSPGSANTEGSRKVSLSKESNIKDRHQWENHTIKCEITLW